MTVYIQKNESDGYLFDGCYCAYEGAMYKNYKTVLFNDIDEVPIVKNPWDILVVACVEDTIKYFKKVGINVPNSINIPDSIRHFISRSLYYMTLEHFKDFEKERPMFVKPAFQTKAFPSGVIRKRNNLGLLLSDYKGSWDITVMASNVVYMVSEYRIFVSKKKGVLGMKHYQGDCFVYPDNYYINNVVDLLTHDTKMPATFSVDVAVVDNELQRIPNTMSRYYTDVVECQDAWSIGAYGLDCEIYTNFLIERWVELFDTCKDRK